MVIIKDKLKIKILENNNEVFPILIRDIGENLKVGEDVALVRFDTYADFLVPRNVQADEIQTLNHLVDSINNQCWILPAVYKGYITKIFWFKPPWAHQFLDGVYQLQIGKCQQTGLLKVASPLPYFTSNCVYSPIDKLSNIHTVDIYISTSGLAKNYSTTTEKTTTPIYDNENETELLDNDNRKKAKLSMNDTNHKNSPSSAKRIYALDAKLINELLATKQFLIDIDLSFFSTDDSIRKQFDENEYEILRYVYTRIAQEHSDTEILPYMTARLNTLEQIRTIMNEYLNDPKQDQPISIDNTYLAALIAIIRYKKLDWKSIHNYGIHLSDTRPPLHVSSEGMILYLLESMAKVLESIEKHPILITVSRCVNDGFCSLEQADLIQLHVEKKLRKLYKIDEIIGKSLSKSLANDDNNEDDYNDEGNQEKKSLTKTNDEHTHRLNTTNDDKTIHMETTNKSVTSKNDNDINISSSMNLNNQKSLSPSKSNLSPGEIKPISPSSLSETSPISN
ncbi:unnamed protein product [Rotaria sp. Silwood2]|nr:unnamed protein product [Rotaria sp. Silwood2]CAF2645217.1 unnamed protein product [Rotaria sp. Silwood2]CAF3059091.1 unnamed protein product [Rotaria sp. Silwood2]CAF3906754.1 unnamed protein product [Rotaria sp. Silwood2]CAF4052591.1 unnamed protein product [Rotaria sp. Silwood2]